MKQVNHFKYVGVWVIKEERIGMREIKNCIGAGSNSRIEKLSDA